MQPSTRGMVVLTAAVVLWSCSSDPTDSFQTGEHITATPSTVIVNQGASEFVTVQLVDEQGNQLAGNFTAQNVGPGITVVKDEEFLPTSGGPLQTSARFVVTGTAPAGSSFEVVAGGVTDTIPVSVVPTGASVPLATVASTGPNASDPTVLTVPAPFQFEPGTGVDFDAGTGVLISRSEDGRSITVLPPPGTTTTGTASLVTDYLPAVAFPTTTDVALTINPTLTPLPGTSDPATAPEITIPAPGQFGGFIDGASFGAATCGDNTGAPCQLYKFTLPADGSFDVTMTWSNTTDLGFYVISADGTTDAGQFCDANGNGDTAQPEACTITLTAGTYLASIVSFGPFYDPVDPEPTWVGVSLSTPAE